MSLTICRANLSRLNKVTYCCLYNLETYTCLKSNVSLRHLFSSTVLHRVRGGARQQVHRRRRIVAEFSPCEIVNHNCTKYIVVVNSNYNNDLWLTLIILGTGTPDPFWERFPFFRLVVDSFDKASCTGSW